MIRGSVDTLELEVRRIAGVVGVSFIDTDDQHVMRVLAPAPADSDEVERAAASLARSHVDWAVEVQIEGNRHYDTEANVQRVHIVSVTAVANEDRIEVRVRRGTSEATGIAQSITLASAAEATISALSQLGVDVPYQVKTATPLGASLSDAVVVVLRGTNAVDGERLGIATAESTEHAAAKATLDALNRYLADNEAFVVELD